jgi:hypothetical protein
MATKLSTKVINVKSLNEAGLEALIDTVYDLMSKVFDGATREGIVEYLGDDDVMGAWVQFFHNQAGDCVGFNNITLREWNTKDGAVAIFRAQAGILREYRGGGSTVLYPLFKALAFKAGHPFTRVYYFGHLLHPSSYYLLFGMSGEIWPRPGRETPPDVHALITQLADTCGYPPPEDPDRPYARASHVKTRESENDRDFWLTSEKPAIRFYVDQVPDFSEGAGLLALIPLTWTNLAVAAGRFAWRMLLRFARR